MAFFFVAFAFFGFLTDFAGGVGAGTISATGFGCADIASGNVDCDDVVVDIMGFGESGTMTVLFGNIVIGVGFRIGSGVGTDDVGMSCACCEGIAINCDGGGSDCATDTLIGVGCVVNWIFGPAVTTISLVCVDGGGD